MNYTNEQLQKAFEGVPPTVQDYILSDEVMEKLQDVANAFSLTDESDKREFRRGVFALLVAMASADNFIASAQEKFDFSKEEAGRLFGEVGDKIMLKAYDLYNQAMKEIDEKSPTPLKTSQAIQPRPAGEVRKFVGLPNYGNGVEKPASSYTSVLPRSQIELNKLKDTPTADSFIKKLDSLGNQSMATAGERAAASAATKTSVVTNPTAPTPVASTTQTPAIPVTPIKTAPPPPNLPVLEKYEGPIELAKLARPVNIPQKEVLMTPPPTPTPSIPPKPTPPPIPSTTQQPKPYPKGYDPYREQPLP